ncbi:hypothetical protein STCU_04578 [Strigomonas culicis]|uniref:Uncharacterized protein n=1 Tax=Strigomonas culicis TaxID=28005 RepID=S9UKU7_9TRYP|nr:hypothetical protein STCU_04578 [Strigomonas culicis]|eukprot:EPY29394.1 hypothetical protein STCU_04578 [Strigomonas culicis]
MTECVEDRAPSLKSSSARQRSFHFNAPHSVVDPLVSLLYDLRRLEESILSSLTEMGVDVNALPAAVRPTKSTPAPAPLPPTCPPGARSPPAKESFVSRYVRGSLDREACSLQEKTMAVEAVLMYVDAHHPRTEMPCPANSATAEGRRLLSVLVASDGAGGERPVWVDQRPTGAARQDSTPETAPPHKRRRAESPLRFVHSADAVPLAHATLMGEYTTADVQHMLREWAHYEGGLSLVVEGMQPLLRALCAPTIGGSLSSHAKWIEVSKEDVQSALTPPSATGIREAAEELIAVNDALATVQAPVHDAYRRLECALEEYTAECLFVNGYERRYWKEVERFEIEYRAVAEIKSRIERVRSALQQYVDGVEDCA